MTNLKVFSKNIKKRNARDKGAGHYGKEEKTNRLRTNMKF